MSNLQFEYQNSISINALTLFCKGCTFFDHHKKGIQLTDVFNELQPKKKSKSKSVNTELAVFTDAKQSDDSNFNNLNEMLSTEKDLSQHLFQIRERIKAAIVNKELIIDDFDTKDCCEIRLNFGVAKTWLKSETSIVVIKTHSKDFRKDKKDNILLMIAALMEMNKKEATNASAGEIADILMGNYIELDVKTIGDYLKEAGSVLTELREKNKKVT